MSPSEPDIISTADYEEYADPQQPESPSRQWTTLIPNFGKSLATAFNLLKNRVSQDRNLNLNSSVSVISQAESADPSHQSHSYHSSNLPFSTITPGEFYKCEYLLANHHITLTLFVPGPLLRPSLFWCFLFGLPCSTVALISKISFADHF